MASVIAESLRPVAARAIHIKIDPAPRNLYESRHVLRVLEQFGRVSMFKNLRYDTQRSAPNSMIAIFDTPEAASKILAEAPLRFTVAPPRQHGSVTSAASFNVSSLFESSGPRPPTAGDEKNTKSTDLQPREYLLSVDKSFADHEAAIERQRYYWGFPQSSRSFIQDDLAKSVPLDGLASLSGTSETLPNRVVKHNAGEIAARKTLRQLLNETYVQAP